MSTTSISQQPCVTGVRRPAFDLMIEKLARRLLRWSDNRAQRAELAHVQPTHERMALIRENEQFRAWAGSPFGR